MSMSMITVMIMTMLGSFTHSTMGSSNSDSIRDWVSVRAG